MKIPYSVEVKPILLIEFYPKQDIDRGLHVTYNNDDGEGDCIMYCDIHKGQIEYALPEDFKSRNIIKVEVIPSAE